MSHAARVSHAGCPVSSHSDPVTRCGALCLGAPTAGAVPAKKLDNNLAALWTTVLQTPSAQNPFGTGGAAFACLDLGGTVAPFGPNGVESCTVKPGTKIFVAATSSSAARSRGMGRQKPNYGACAGKGT